MTRHALKKPDADDGDAVVPTAPEYLDPPQAARHMNVPERYLQEICLRGDGPPRISLSRKCHRYRRADIDAWMAARAHHNAPAN